MSCIVSEEAQYHGLATIARHDGNSNIDGFSLAYVPYATILRRLMFVGAQMRKHFYASYDLLLYRAREKAHMLKHSIDAYANSHSIIARLQMDVRCAALERMRNERIDKGDN